ncbi:MAG: CdaR family transcriptional regulator [Rhodococcus sp.]|nr:CdaR family transcriptional regulator [Rhodococcus sp. (in: high G+C Gram-positive bacteria)]
MDDAELRNWMAELAPHYLQPSVIDEFVQRVDDEIEAQNPEVAADPSLRRDIDASTSAQLRLIIAAVLSGSDEVTPPPESMALALTVARRGLDLGVLLKIYGVGRMAALRFVNEVIDDVPIDPDAKRAVLVRIWAVVMAWLETTTERLVAAYASEREELNRGALARRADTVHALLAGKPIHIDEASRLLDHPMRRYHTAFVVWTDQMDPPSDILGVLSACARAMAACLGSPRVLSITSGAHELWAWVAHIEEPRVAELREEQIPAGRGLRVAVGSPGYGMAGFTRSHREAQAARGIAVRARVQAPLTVFDAVQVPCLMTDDHETLRALVARELRGLAATGTAATRLRETLLVHYANNCKPAVTAEVLGVHKNTVRYRLDQAADLLGHDLDERRLTVELALISVDTYGDGLLESEPPS